MLTLITTRVYVQYYISENFGYGTSNIIRTYINDESTPTLLNCIVWGDSIYGGYPNVDYSNIDGGHEVFRRRYNSFDTKIYPSP